MNEYSTQFKQILREAKDYFRLRIEYGKLTVTEKLSIVLSNLALSLICLLLAVIGFFFLSMAAMDWMAQSLGRVWSGVIMASFYIVVIAAIIALRKPLIIDPMTRMISKIILK